jgi:hypothetical protein
MIWRHVLGDMTIHVKYVVTKRSPPFSLGPWATAREIEADTRMFLSFICEANLSKEGHTDVACNGHLNCYKYFAVNAKYGSWEEKLHEGLQSAWHVTERELPLQILRVCHQTYVEANPVLWSTNTFSFNSAIAFGKFMYKANALQRRLLRKIHVDLDCRYSTELAYYWGLLLKREIVKKCQSIESLSVAIREAGDGEKNTNMALLRGGYRTWYNLLTNFQFKHWKEVHVSCVNIRKEGGLPNMTTEETMQMAGSLRAMLLSTPKEEAQKKEKRETEDKQKEDDQRQGNQEEGNQEEGNQ